MRIYFEPRDLWFGVYIGKSKRTSTIGRYSRSIYFCPIPMLVVEITIYWNAK